jgi:hypothetical protein
MTGVDVWIVPVIDGAHADPALVEIVGGPDMARIARLGFASDRDRAITARVAARIEIGRRLGLTAAAVPITTEGPPVVAASDLAVSWAHSGDWVALAVGNGRGVGVDIEAAPRRLDRRALQAIGVSTLEEFVALEAATKATSGRHEGRFPPGVTVTAIDAPAGYAAAVAGLGGALRVRRRSPSTLGPWCRSPRNDRSPASAMVGSWRHPVPPLDARRIR